MANDLLNWEKRDFLAFVLVFAAQSDNNISQEEMNEIMQIVGKDSYLQAIHELAFGNDYQNIQKILSYTKDKKLTSEEINVLLKEIKELFFADGEFSQLERNLFLIIKRLLPIE